MDALLVLSEIAFAGECRLTKVAFELILAGWGRLALLVLLTWSFG